MSRNYELITQLEIRSGAGEDRKDATADRAASFALAPTLSSYSSGSEGEEMLRFIQRIFLSASGKDLRQVVLCGVEKENGSSSVCAKAGRTLAANSSRPVCLVDANVRSPRLSGLFGIEGRNPFSGPSAPLRELCVKVGANLWIAGPNILTENCRVLMPPTQLKERFKQLRDEFEYMLIDAPGTGVCGDAQLLGHVADAAILVVEANSTRRLMARKAIESLDAAGVRVLGTVLNNRTFAIPEAIYRRL